MQLNISIPDFGGSGQSIQLENSECLFIVGRNGSGKSSLIQYIYRLNPSSSRWISALRQNALSSAMPSMTPDQRERYGRNLAVWDADLKARWWNPGTAGRPDAAMVDLLDRRNRRNSEITREVDGGNTDRATLLSREERDPLRVMSSLLTSAGMEFELDVDKGGFYATTPMEDKYPVDRLSDGERNVFLLCCEVLTAPPETIILIDEPERHLHRAISSSLVANLIEQRQDCSFIVATNDIDLTSSVPNAKVLIVRNCRHESGDAASAWDINLIGDPSGVDEQTRVDILGARQRVVFVEGERDSLDYRLYSTLFPDVSVIPKGSRRDVEGAVRSIRGASKLHWVKAFGIVDGDGDQTNPVPNTNGVTRIPFDSVESIYFDEHLQRRVVERKQKFNEPDDTGVDERLADARERALDAIRSTADDIAQRMALRELDRQWREGRPNAKATNWGEDIEIRLAAPAKLKEAKERLDALVESEDVSQYIREWPTKRTQIPSVIARALGLHDKEDYYRAVQRLLQDDASARQYVIELLGELPAGLLTSE